MDLTEDVGKSFPSRGLQNERRPGRPATETARDSDLTTELEEQHFGGGIFPIVKPKRTILPLMVGADTAAGSTTVDLMNSQARSQVKRAPGFQKNCAATFVGQKILQGLSFHFLVSDLHLRLELRVIQTANWTQTALRKLLPMTGQDTDAHPRIESVSEVSQ